MRKLTILALAFILCFSAVSQAAEVAWKQGPGWGPNCQPWIATALTSTNTSTAILNTTGYSLVEVQIKGTWGAGTVNVYGSDDGKNWAVLTGLPLGVPTAITYSADPSSYTLLPVWETPNYIYATIGSANGTDSVVVTVTGRK